MKVPRKLKKSLKKNILKNLPKKDFNSKILRIRYIDKIKGNVRYEWVANSL